MHPLEKVRANVGATRSAAIDQIREGITRCVIKADYLNARFNSGLRPRRLAINTYDRLLIRIHGVE